MTNGNVAIIIILVVILILAVFIGRSFVTPGQQVAQAPTPIPTSPSETISPTPVPSYTPANGNVGVGTYDVRITYRSSDQSFSPRDVTLPVGGTITFANPGSTDLVITSADNPVFAPLNTGPIAYGSIYIIQFNQKGTFHYTSNQNSSEVGTIRVQ